MDFYREVMENLLAVAREARKKAYAPYSVFQVGAAVLGGSGKVYTGCNVENASYGLSICAERTAIVKAISEGERWITAIAIVADESEITRPCGACIQFVSEFSNPEQPTQIIAGAVHGVYDYHTIDQYMPMRFTLDKQQG